MAAAEVQVVDAKKSPAVRGGEGSSRREFDGRREWGSGYVDQYASRMIT